MRLAPRSSSTPSVAARSARGCDLPHSSRAIQTRTPSVCARWSARWTYFGALRLAKQRRASASRRDAVGSSPRAWARSARLSAVRAASKREPIAVKASRASASWAAASSRSPAARARSPRTRRAQAAMYGSSIRVPRSSASSATLRARSGLPVLAQRLGQPDVEVPLDGPVLRADQLIAAPLKRQDRPGGVALLQQSQAIPTGPGELAVGVRGVILRPLARGQPLLPVAARRVDPAAHPGPVRLDPDVPAYFADLARPAGRLQRRVELPHQLVVEGERPVRLAEPERLVGPFEQRDRLPAVLDAVRELAGHEAAAGEDVVGHAERGVVAAAGGSLDRLSGAYSTARSGWER